MNLQTFKLAAKIVSTFGVGKVINDIISNNTTILTTADQVKVAVGSLVLGGMVIDQAVRHVDETVDQAAAWYAARKVDSDTA